MSYSKEDKKKAFIAYKELRSLTKASEVLNIPRATLAKWSITYDWQKKIEDEQSSLIPKPIDHEYEVKKIAEEFGLSRQDAETLKQVKTIEAVIFSSIYKRPEDEADTITLRPLSFESAMRALKICWDSKNALFNSKKETSNGEKPKINYIAQVTNYIAQDKERPIDITPEGLIEE